MKNKFFKSAIIITFAALCACVAKPRNVATLNTSSNISEELAQTRRDLDYEKANQLALLSPENFRKAENKLEDAEDGLARKRNGQRISDDLAQARGWLDDARQVGQRARGLFAAPLDARANAITVFDPDNRELIKTDKDLKEVADNVEKGKDVSERAIRKLTADYNEVELSRIERTQINPIESRIKQAKGLNAKRVAPRSLDRAEADFKAIERTIRMKPL